MSISCRGLVPRSSSSVLVPHSHIVIPAAVPTRLHIMKLLSIFLLLCINAAILVSAMDTDTAMDDESKHSKSENLRSNQKHHHHGHHPHQHNLGDTGETPSKPDLHEIDSDSLDAARVSGLQPFQSPQVIQIESVDQEVDPRGDQLLTIKGSGFAALAGQILLVDVFPTGVNAQFSPRPAEDGDACDGPPNCEACIATMKRPHGGGLLLLHYLKKKKPCTWVQREGCREVGGHVGTCPGASQPLVHVLADVTTDTTIGVCVGAFNKQAWKIAVKGGATTVRLELLTMALKEGEGYTTPLVIGMVDNLGVKILQTKDTVDTRVALKLKGSDSENNPFEANKIFLDGNPDFLAGATLAFETILSWKLPESPTLGRDFLSALDNNKNEHQVVIVGRGKCSNSASGSGNEQFTFGQQQVVLRALQHFGSARGIQSCTAAITPERRNAKKADVEAGDAVKKVEEMTSEEKDFLFYLKFWDGIGDNIKMNQNTERLNTFLKDFAPSEASGAEHIKQHYTSITWSEREKVMSYIKIEFDKRMALKKTVARNAKATTAAALVDAEQVLVACVAASTPLFLDDENLSPLKPMFTANIAFSAEELESLSPQDQVTAAGEPASILCTTLDSSKSYLRPAEKRALCRQEWMDLLVSCAGPKHDPPLPECKLLTSPGWHFRQMKLLLTNFALPGKGIDASVLFSVSSPIGGVPSYIDEVLNNAPVAAAAVHMHSSNPQVAEEATTTWESWQQRAKRRRRPPVIGLAHELVHAYYMVTGTRQFGEGNTMDEALTAGIGQWEKKTKFNENRFRKAWNQNPGRTEDEQLPMREFYGTSQFICTRCGAGMSSSAEKCSNDHAMPFSLAPVLRKLDL